MRDQQPPQPRSVWLTGQLPSRLQRTGRYLPASTNHPAKMLPAIARHAIALYTAPGDLVLDPMCGIGTTCVEALHLGREALGVEYELHWTELAHANITHARRTLTNTTHITHADPAHPADARDVPAATVLRADARDLTRVVPPGTAGRVALVLTSPPYGAGAHGHVTATPGRGVAKRHHRYSDDRANLAHRPLPELLEGFTQILAAAAALLRPGGKVVLTTRPYRRGGELIDLPGAVITAADHAGLTLHDRAAALIAGVYHRRIVNHGSFFAMHNIRTLRDRGLPAYLIAHEDVLVFTARTG